MKSMSARARALRLRGAAAVMAVLIAGPVTASAAPIAAWDAGAITAFCGGFTCGIRFQVTDDLSLLALGGYELAFTASAQVGIWDAGGTLLRSVTSTTADVLVGGYYYEAVIPLLLSSGSVYTVGLWTDQAFATGPTPSPTNVNPDLQLQTGVFRTFGTGFGFPDITDSRFFAGANFLSESAVVPVPEPSTLSLMGLGIAGLAAARGKRAH